MGDSRIAVPSDGNGGLEGTRSGHFGHCSVFTIIDVTDGKIADVDIVRNPAHVEGGCMVPVNLLSSHKVNAIIVSGMGYRPLMGFNQAGIDVYYDQKSPEIKTVIKDFIEGKLELMTNDKACGGGNH